MAKQTLRTKVESVLNRSEATRNSDVELTLQVWWYFYKELLEDRGDKGVWVRLRDVRELPSEDKIGRIRRKLQELGKYPATDPVVIARRHREDKIRTTIKTEDWGEGLE